MEKANLHPEVRASITRTPRIPFSNRKLFWLNRTLYNLGAKSRLPENVETRYELFRGVQVLSLLPENRKYDGAILWMYGGGHWAGRPEHLYGIAGRAAHELGVPVLIPRYRLAPEHPFPADLEDCFRVWQWLQSFGTAKEIDRDKIIIAGNSAGGGLAAALVQKALDEGEGKPLAQCLFYPMLDDRTAVNTELNSVNHFIWNNQANYEAWKAYLAPYEPGARALPPYAAPGRRTDLSGLPPAWIGMCELDLFFAEYESYAQRLSSYGVACETYVADRVPHAFEVFKPNADIAKRFVSSSLYFMAASFAGTAFGEAIEQEYQAPQR